LSRLFFVSILNPFSSKTSSFSGPSRGAPSPVPSSMGFVCFFSPSSSFYPAFSFAFSKIHLTASLRTQITSLSPAAPSRLSDLSFAQICLYWSSLSPLMIFDFSTPPTHGLLFSHFLDSQSITNPGGLPCPSFWSNPPQFPPGLVSSPCPFRFFLGCVI